MKNYKRLSANRISINPYIVFQGYILILLFAGILITLTSADERLQTTAILDSKKNIMPSLSPIVLSITKSGKYSLNTFQDNRLLTWTELYTQLSTRAQQGTLQKEDTVWLQSDRQVEYSHVLRLIEALRTFGITQISLVTRSTH